MLAQLVCVDRRYQRMNCFNIRELQSMLKRRFFVDLVNSNDHRELLNNSMIGLRYKTNSNNLIDADITNFYNFGTTFSDKIKSNMFVNTNATNSLNYPYTLMSGIVSTFLIPISWLMETSWSLLFKSIYEEYFSQT